MTYPKAVVALTGARDQYQLPLALHETGLLCTSVTDFYWPADQGWFSNTIGRIIPDHIIEKRFCEALGSQPVSVSRMAFWGRVFDRAHVRSALRLENVDYAVSAAAKRYALKENAALFCYHFQAMKAFEPAPDRPPFRFQFSLQAHLLSSRRLLLEEIEANPNAASSLRSTPEMAAEPKVFDDVVNSYAWSNGWVVSSTYAKQTLAANGISADRIHVIPYGVDTTKFTSATQKKSESTPFTIVFVGSVVYRKGITYLLDAVRTLKSKNVRVVFYSAKVVHQQLLENYADINLEIRIGLSGKTLAQEINRADILVFPSLDEGFGLVILEGMACGLPVITTYHTGGPDVMQDGQHGFIVPIRSAGVIAEKLAWGLDHRDDLAEMGRLAALHAQQFSWAKFREGIRTAYKQMVDDVRARGSSEL